MRPGQYGIFVDGTQIGYITGTAMHYGPTDWDANIFDRKGTYPDLTADVSTTPSKPLKQTLLSGESNADA